MRVLIIGAGVAGLTLGRAALLTLLERAAGVPVRRGTTLTDLVPAAEAVEVGFDDGTHDRFDPVVACDGIASATRERVFGPQPGFDAG